MMIKYDSRGIKPAGTFQLIPEGDYQVEIIGVDPKQSASGNPMFVVKVHVLSPAEYRDVPLTHYVTLLPKESKGAGIAIHFLKTIGEPWEEMETLEVDPDNWVMKTFKAGVVQEDYTRRDGTTSKSNKIKSVMPSDEVPF